MPTSLQSFFLALAAGAEPSSIPAALDHISAGVLRQPMGDFDADDLVGEFILRVLQATRRRSAGSAANLLDLSEPELHAVVRFRMRQIVAEHSGSRRLVKQLRDAVRRAVLRGLPIAEEAPPTSLMVAGRLHGPSVAAATAWLRTTDGAPPADDVAGIAEHLQALYAGNFTREEPAVWSDPGAALDAGCCITRLAAGLSPEELSLLRDRLEGRSLAAVAAGAGVALSTAHSRVAHCLDAVRRTCRDLDVDPEVLGRAFQALAA